MAIRVSETDLAFIDQLADQHGLTRTDYIVRACIGELEDPREIQPQLDSLAERVQRLETVFGT